uniref:Ubiquitin-like domain-containing protein n=1 Tax=Kalanchoe fedtschenkoi TaxID=63787 RepID=A0A7N0ZRC3_KALFE
MGYDSDEDSRDEDEDDDYDGGSRLLGFMFGNVDNSGDLDVDYLDEDAKEHLAALADKLGPSLTEIEFSVKARQTFRDASEQDYDEKAEDAVDYEDIDEQYEGPEIQPTTEEDHLLPRKDYYSAEVSVAAIEPPTTLFDDENYDEDEEVEKEPQLVENALPNENISMSVESGELLDVAPKPTDELPKFDTYDTQTEEVDITDSPERCEVMKEKPVEDKIGEQNSLPLPVLCVEDGGAILRFSEIFGIHEPPKKVEKRSRRYPIPKDRYKFIDASENVEEDEEIYLKGSFQGYSGVKQTHVVCDSFTYFPAEDVGSVKFNKVGGFSKMHAIAQRDYYLSGQPLTEDTNASIAKRPPSPIFYPLEQHNWEDQIIWDDSPAPSSTSSYSYDTSETDAEVPRNNETGLEAQPIVNRLISHTYSNDKDRCPTLSDGSILLEAFSSRSLTELSNDALYRRKYHPQLLRLESMVEPHKSTHADARMGTALEDFRQSDAIRGLSKLTLKNRELVDGSWLDSILWEPHSFPSNPKLIFDLQDEEMLFEIVDNKEGKHLKEHAGAMMISRSLKSIGGDSAVQSGIGSQTSVGFNIANDKFYSNRKTSQQLKSNSKKRTTPGIKVLHSTPALKLQTMKLRLSNKDIANFHRPKAVWYPHVNEVAIKEQEKLPTQGPMKIILKSLGGKGTKLHVDTQETTLSVKAKASKKLDFRPSEIVKIYYFGKELEDDKTLGEQNVQPNSLLHIVRTKIHLLPRAQKLPGDNKPLRPPGAFKKKADLSAKDGHIFLMEYCEERPLLLGNVGMGARLCTYYQKSAPNDLTGIALKNSSKTLGSLIVLDPSDKSPFLGDIKPGCCQSSLETNMYRAPVFPHKVASTDYLLIRSAKGRLSIRRIDRVDAVGQQEPHMEVMSPGDGAKGPLPKFLNNRLLVYIYREFLANEKRGLYPRIRADELAAQFPHLKESFLRKLLKHCADYQKGQNGQFFWTMRQNFRLPTEEELRRLVPPELVSFPLGCVWFRKNLRERKIWGKIGRNPSLV